MRGWSQGDAWTLGLGLSLALVLAATTVPVALEDRGQAPRARVAAAPPPAALPPADAPAPAPAPAASAPQGQPLLGPLAPLAQPAALAAPAEPPAKPYTAQPSARPLAAGAIRLLTALPSAGAPGAVTILPAGGIAVGTDTPASTGSPARLLRLDPLGVLQDSVAVPEQPDDRTRGVTGLTSLPDGGLVVVDAATARVLRFESGRWSLLARVPDLAPCVLPAAPSCQPGIEDAPPLLRGVAVDRAGDVFVADAGQGTVWRLRRGKPIEPWYQSADLAGDDGVAGMAFDAQGHLLLTVTKLAELTGPGAGALLRIERTADGSAGARTVVTAFKAGEDPVDVAVGATGNSYVPLRGADALVVLDPRGVEVLRVVDDALRGPTAVDLRSGRVLVTVPQPRAALLEIGVADRPATPAG
jgi:hypothetical protein